MNISGDLSLVQTLKRTLTKLCQNFTQKALLGLEEPIINSRILSEGFYLSQHLNGSPSKVCIYLPIEYIWHDSFLACTLLCCRQT